jgi:methenyltetrahydromethanopterin cyclohydrolase
MVSINEQAAAIAQRMIEEKDELEIATLRLPNGTTVVDCGIDVHGSLEAGRRFSEICLGGLGHVQLCQTVSGDIALPGVTVWVSDPPVACMASQYAGWAVKTEKYFAMGSGPARALYAHEPLFADLTYRDRADVAVLALEARKLPTEAVATKVAEKCGVAPANLTLLVAPTASLVGSVQVSARVVETGLHKMLEVGYDITTVRAGIGSCPLAPVAQDDLHAIGRTNDAVLYGGRAWYTVETQDAAIEAVIDRLPSSASRDYGTPFYDLFQRYNGDFYQIDPLLFSPAEICINNVVSGKTFRVGQVNPAIIQKGLLG